MTAWHKLLFRAKTVRAGLQSDFQANVVEQEARHTFPNSESEVRESLVRVGHLVCVFPLFHGVALAVESVGELAAQFLHHGFACPFARVRYQPSNRKRSSPMRR